MIEYVYICFTFSIKIYFIHSVLCPLSLSRPMKPLYSPVGGKRRAVDTSKTCNVIWLASFAVFISLSLFVCVYFPYIALEAPASPPFSSEFAFTTVGLDVCTLVSADVVNNIVQCTFPEQGYLTGNLTTLQASVESINTALSSADSYLMEQVQSVNASLSSADSYLMEQVQSVNASLSNTSSYLMEQVQSVNASLSNADSYLMQQVEWVKASLSESVSSLSAVVARMTNADDIYARYLSSVNAAVLESMYLGWLNPDGSEPTNSQPPPLFSTFYRIESIDGYPPVSDAELLNINAAVPLTMVTRVPIAGMIPQYDSDYRLNGAINVPRDGIHYATETGSLLYTGGTGIMYRDASMPLPGTLKDMPFIDWTPYTVTIAGGGTKAVSATGGSVIEQAMFMIVGQRMRIQYTYRQSGVSVANGDTLGLAGTTTYRFSYPLASEMKGCNVYAQRQTLIAGTKRVLGTASVHACPTTSICMKDYTASVLENSNLGFNIYSNLNGSFVGNTYAPLSTLYLQYDVSLETTVACDRAAVVV
jgi:hypothetical protein